MGSCFSQEPEVDFNAPVDFNHFHILRAIGKGAFGKVCIVKKKDTKQMYAMKYMDKVQIIKKHAVDNVFREIDLLKVLDHDFLVNLWFTFQDREDIFLVLDLMLGGDLSYHLEKEGRFQVPRVRLYMAELAHALEYLREKYIIHRDLKPANFLLDSAGHVHLTDFNVACVVKPGVPVTSLTGTKPYMAPEVFHHGSHGYTYAVDWWSLGVSCYEMLRGQRPFPMERTMSNEEIYTQMRHTRPSASARWDEHTCDILKLLLHHDEDKRFQSIEAIAAHPFFDGFDMEKVKIKETTPVFIPPQNRINCDPTHELEEMIVEPNPLHKKAHRLSKRHYKAENDEVMEELERISERFQPYDRNKDKTKRESVLVGRLSTGNDISEEEGNAEVKIHVETVNGSGEEQVGESESSQERKEEQVSEKDKIKKGCDTAESVPQGLEQDLADGEQPMIDDSTPENVPGETKGAQEPAVEIELCVAPHEAGTEGVCQESTPDGLSPSNGTLEPLLSAS